MKKILFVVSLIGAWLIGKIKLSEPPTITYTPDDNGWYNPKINIFEHIDGLLEVEIYNDGVLIDDFVVENEQQLKDYLKEEYNANISWL